MTDDEDVGAFVCSCADSCDIDLERAREKIDDVAFAASSDLLCGDDTVDDVVEMARERELTDVVATCPAEAGRRRLQRVEEEADVELSYVDQREGAGWVHGTEAATEKASRLVNARRQTLAREPEDTVDAGDTVAVVGDVEAAINLPEDAEVHLIAEEQELSDVDVDLDDVYLVQGTVVDVEGRLGMYRVTVESRVTEDCVDCMKCVEVADDEEATSEPVDLTTEEVAEETEELCPTDAIEPTGARRTLEASQVIYPDGVDDSVAGKAGLHVDGEGSDGRAADVMDLLGERPRYLELEMDVCAAGDSGETGCTRCYDSCPHDAVSKPESDRVEFHEAACRNCGACTSLCPTGAVELTERSNEDVAREVEALVEEEDSDGLLQGDEALENQVVAFVCSERAAEALRRYGRRSSVGDADVGYPPLLPVSVSCADTVGEAHVLHALASGADGVVVLGCGSSCRHSGGDPKQELVDRLNTACSDLGLGERVEFLTADVDDTEGFVEEAWRFYEDLERSPIPYGGHTSTGSYKVGDEALPMHSEAVPGYANHGWLVESVYRVLEHVEPERRRIRGLDGFAVVDVDDSCALTPTCTNLCPVGALDRTEDSLEFDHRSCVNCGLCENGCPESAITLEPVLDIDLLAEEGESGWTTVYEDELWECRRCGEGFTSLSTVEKMKEEIPDADVDGVEGHIAEYCGDCKAELSFQL